MPQHVYKQCGCGRTYTRDQWQRLPQVVRDGNRVPVQCLPADESGPAQALCYRNCLCGSTIVVDLFADRAARREVA